MKNKIIEYKKKIYFNQFFIWILRLIVPIILFFLKVKVMKIKGKIPLKGPILIAAHHEGLADQYIIVIQTKRKLFWIADTTPPSSSTSFADQKFKKWLLLRLGAIPIDKKNPKRNVHLFEYLLFLLKKGEAIVFFPEAYLRDERNDKKFGKFKDGIVKLALEYEKRFNKKNLYSP